MEWEIPKKIVVKPSLEVFKYKPDINLDLKTEPIDRNPNYVNPYAFVLAEKRIFIKNMSDDVKIDVIKTIILSKTNYPEELVFSSKRYRELVDIRHMFFYFARRYTLMSLSEIGRYANKDHATVLHSCKMFQTIYDVDEEYRNKAHTIDAEYNSAIVNIENEKSYSTLKKPTIRDWEEVKENYI